jgi:CxxC motif-containing protein (DUF1111 family)
MEPEGDEAGVGDDLQHTLDGLDDQRGLWALATQEWNTEPMWGVGWEV